MNADMADGEPAGVPQGLRVVGRIESPLLDLDDAPRQPDEGAPHATVVIEPDYAEAITGLAPGDQVVLVTWLHLADRATLTTYPRGDHERGLAGVFSTRSPHRPNPIGLHEATILDVVGNRIRVDGLEALDGTPVLDIKPTLNDIENR